MRILTELEYLEGKLPQSSFDFSNALEYFEKNAVDEFLGEEVISAMPYGSVLRSDCSLGSDIDYLMISRDLGHRDRVLEVAEDVYQRFHVPMNILFYPLSDAEIGLHDIDCAFSQHIRFSLNSYPDSLKGQNPFDIIDFSLNSSLEKSLHDTLVHYVNGFSRKLLKAYSPEGKIPFFKFALEKPFHTMRVMAQYHDVLDYTPLSSDTKENLIDVYCNLGESYNSLFETYISSDSENNNSVLKTANFYSDLLEARVDSKQDASSGKSLLKQKHRNLLNRLEGMAPISEEFIRNNLQLIN